nr:hypothetical protein [Calothrix sp. MO_167.B42]
TVIPISGNSTFSFNVNVANNAPASVTNNVSVSGGNEPAANNGNNTGSDTTSIIIPATSGPTFICDGQFFLAQIPSGGDANQDPSEVSIVDTSNKILNLQFTLNNPSNVFANAIGLNVQDGYMYGIDRKNQLTDRDNEDVIRIAADGTHINLGNPYGIGSAAGDVSPDGIYHIFNSKKFYKFNVTGLNSATSAGIVNIQNSSSIPGFLDIAFNPFDGNIYATHQTDDKIYIIDPNDGSWRTLTAPGLNLTGATGAMYFDPFGNFYAYQNSNGNLYKIVFDNPANPQSATAEIFVANPPNVSKNDGAACPFQPKIEKTVDPQTTPAGQSVTYTYRLTNPNGYPITTKLTDTMPSTDGRTFITVVSNSLGGTETISGDKKTLEITGLTLPGKTVNTIAVTVNVPANTPATTPTSPILNQATLSGLPAIFGGTVLSDYPDDPGFSDPTPLQVTTPIASNPSVLLVKRITAINGNSTNNPNDNTPLNIFVDDTTSSRKDDDNHPNWPSNYLIGAIDGGKVKPGEEVEYTIYFLSTGDNTASNVLMCDLVPENLTFLPTAYNNSHAPATATLTGSDRGIVHSYNSNTVSTSGIQDGDVSQYFPPGVEPSTVYANIDCDGDPNTNIPNTNGAVVVNLGDLPHATTPGQSNSYGFVRFRGKVK